MVPMLKDPMKLAMKNEMANSIPRPFTVEDTKESTVLSNAGEYIVVYEQCIQETKKFLLKHASF